jgi:hypothetical protein
MVIADLLARAGDRRRAAAQLAAVRAHPVFPAIKEPAWLALLAEPCHLLGDAELARAIYPALLPHAARFLCLGPIACYCDPPYGRQLGLLAQTFGRLDAAVGHLADAEALTREAGMRPHLARLRYELAGALLARGRAGDREQAAGLLAAARELARELDQTDLLPLIAAREAAAAIEGAETPAPGAAAPEGGAAAAARAAAGGPATLSLRREGEYWTIWWAGSTLRLRDSRGLRVLERLVASPGRELHVLQLVSEAVGGGADGDEARGGPGRRDDGDAGPLLDPEAERSYRSRLHELRDEVAEAERFNDVGRAGRARAEIDFLTRELARAVGLGGRSRRAGAAAERARTTVQKRLRNAIQRIGQDLPALARHLDRTVRTGTFCCYLPDDGAGG